MPRSARPSPPPKPRPQPRAPPRQRQEDAVRRRTAETAAAQAALLRAQAALVELEARNARLRAGLAAREAEREALLGSRSWKLTAPLRTVARRLRRGGPPPAQPETET